MLVSEAQEEDGSCCCVPIKSKWQSDLGEAKRGYIFSQTFSQGCSFSCLVFFYFIYAPMLAAWLPGFYRDACLQNRAHETIRPLSWGTETGNWLLHITCFFKAVSIKGLSLHTGCRRESLTQLLKSGLRGVRGAVAQRAVGWNNVLFF